MRFNGPLKFMLKIVAIHSNSDVIIGILRLTLKRWKNHMIMYTVWSKLPTDTGKTYNIPCLTLASLGYLASCWIGVQVP